MRRVEVKVKVGRGKVGRAKEGRAKGKQEEQALRRVGGLGLSLQCWTLSPFLAVHSLHCSDTGSVQSLSRVLILAKLRGLQISFGLIKIGPNLQETFRVIGGQLL